MMTTLSVELAYKDAQLVIIIKPVLSVTMDLYSIILPVCVNVKQEIMSMKTLADLAVL